MGIATIIGVSPAITAGAVISGAYLGDKTSPLSETTILTAQMVGVDLYEHIRHQAWTSVPAFVFSVAVFFVLGFTGPTPDSDVANQTDLTELGNIFTISPWTLLPLVLLGFLSIRKVPASLALAGATLFAGVLGAFTQPDVYRGFVAAGGNVVTDSIRAVWIAMANGFHSDSGVTDVDRLLSRGGMDSMLLTIWLILAAVTFGSLLERFGLIDRIVQPMITSATSTGRLYLTVFGCGFGLNVVAGDQYIALVLPSRIFRAEFEERGLAPKNLSRLAADSATVTSPLVPWNSCGAFMSATLGVSTLLYLPYALFCWASPFLSVLYGITGFTIEKVKPPTEEGSLS